MRDRCHPAARTDACHRGMAPVTACWAGQRSRCRLHRTRVSIGSSTRSRPSSRVRDASHEALACACHLASTDLRAGSYVVALLAAATVAVALARGLIGSRAAAVVGDSWKILTIEHRAQRRGLHIDRGQLVLRPGHWLHGHRWRAGGWRDLRRRRRSGGGPRALRYGGFPSDHLWIHVVAGSAGGCLAAATGAFLLFDDDEAREA